MKKIICLLTMLVLAETGLAQNPTSVPISHPVYHFLDRMETTGILDNILDGVKPFDRGHIAELLKVVESQRERLSAIDQRVLDNYLLDFRFEIDPTQKYARIENNSNIYSPFSSLNNLKADFLRFFARNDPEEDNHLFLWEDSTNSFYLDFNYDVTYDQRSDDVSRSKEIMTFEARGSLTSQFGYMAQISLANIHGDYEYRNQDPFLKKTWRNNRENVTYFDRSSGDIGLHTPWVDLHFAIQPTTWGVGESGILILSDNVEQYPYLSISKRWGWGNFVFMHGKLLAEQSGQTEEGQKIYPDKWIAGNRFEFSPWSGMAIALTGLIVYGNRSADWTYLFPINYFRAGEHNLRDRDNALISLDLEWRIFNGLKVYGTLFLDELRKDKIGTDWYGNKQAFQAGLHLADPLGIDNFSVHAEYVAVMPWVYTHKYSINRFTNDSLSLGHWAGPNSEVIYFHVEKRFSRRLNTGIKLWQWKHGRNYPNENIGGDIMLGHNTLLGDQEEARETRKFLEGILETEKKAEFYADYELFNGFFIRLKAAAIHYQNPSEEQKLSEIHIGLGLEY
jgi:hypothetical protein